MKPSPLKAFSYILAIGLTLASCQKEDAAPQFRRAGPESNIVRIATASEPHSLDPRQARMLCASTVLGLMFEGLMRHDSSGKLEPGVAQSVELSDDRTTYTFHLRESYWSNGDPVTAEDFIYSWKSMLAPDFPAPNAFQLYSIKHAKAAKAGKGSLDDVAIHAKDPYTLLLSSWKSQRLTSWILQHSTLSFRSIASVLMNMQTGQKDSIISALTALFVLRAGRIATKSM